MSAAISPDRILDWKRLRVLDAEHIKARQGHPYLERIDAELEAARADLAAYERMLEVAA